MSLNHSDFPFGIEEEYYLVDLDTRDLAAEVPARLFAAFKAALGTQFSTEYVRSQIEVNTPVCHSMAQARRRLLHFRRTIADLAAPHGLAPIAASTHPFARWRHQDHTDSPRYNSIADDLQSVGRRMVISGLHVHVGIDGDDLRIDLLNGLRQFLPVLLALSTSSPFWQGENTGLKSFRTAVNDATPRRGIPEGMASWSDFQRTVDVLV